MIKLGETIDRKREVAFEMVSVADGRTPVTGINWNTMPATSLKIRAPGGSIGNVDFTRIVEIGDGGYVLQLADAQVANAGTGVVILDASNAVAIPAQWDFTVYDPADFATSGGGGGGGGSLLPSGPVTLDSLISLVRTRGDYLSSLTFTDAYITTEIQAAWRELYEIIAGVHEGWWTQDSTVATVSAQNWIGLPTDCWRVRGVDIQNGTTWRQLRQIGLADRNRYGLSTDTPIAYRLSARGIELFPTPNNVYTLRITYVPIVPVLSDTGIQLYGWQDFIVEAALLRLDEREERPTEERWRRLYDPVNGLKAQIIRAASERRSAEPEVLPIRELTDPWDWGMF